MNCCFTPFEIGQIKAHTYHGLGAAAISKILLKPDGKSHWCPQAVSDALHHLESDPKWRGERKKGTGKSNRKTTKQDDKALVKEMLQQRGKKKVTVRNLKKVVKPFRKVCRTTVSNRLRDAGYGKKPRRDKSLVPKTKGYRASRLEYANWVVSRPQKELNKWCYCDGTTWFLDRDEAEHEHSSRRALGSMVWRRIDGKDSLDEDTIGPSPYSKAQGEPVKVWGLLSMGILYVHILECGENMTSELYVEMVEDMFPEWIGNSRFLVQDFERAIRTADAKEAIQSVGLSLVEVYPKVSQDLNAIENAWISSFCLVSLPFCLMGG